MMMIPKDFLIGRHFPKINSNKNKKMGLFLKKKKKKKKKEQKISRTKYFKNK